MGIEEECIYIAASSVNGTQQIILLLYGYILFLVALKTNTALLRTVLFIDVCLITCVLPEV